MNKVHNLGNLPLPGAHPQPRNYAPCATNDEHDPEKGVGEQAAAPKLHLVSCMGTIWFLAACCVMLAALIGAVDTLFLSFQWVDAVTFCYMFSFGGLLALLDIPMCTQVKIVQEMQLAMGTYIHILTRTTGKGLFLIFLGCSLWAALLANLKRGPWLFVAAALGLLAVVVGLYSLLLGAVKSSRLEKLRRTLRGEGVALHAYAKHAKSQPHAGLTYQEFNQLARDEGADASGDLKKDLATGDILLIFNALSSHPRREAISHRDLERWAAGRMVFL